MTTRLTLIGSDEDSITIKAQSNYYGANIFDFYLGDVYKGRRTSTAHVNGYYYATWTYTGLQPGYSYYLAVRNYLGSNWVDSGGGYFSTTGSTSPPSAPTGLSLGTPVWNSATKKYSCRLYWNSVPDAEYYIVFRNSIALTDTYSTSYNFTGLNPKAYYSFGVSACNSYGESDMRKIGDSMPAAPDEEAPIINSFNVTSVTKTTISCSWNITDGGGSGLAEIALGIFNFNTAKWTWIFPNISSTSYTFSNLTPNTKYQLELYANDDAGNESNVSYITVWTLGDSFEWDYAKVSGQSVNVTANEWTSFQNKINGKRNACGLSNYGFTTVYAGSTDLTATIFNQSINAINQIYNKLGLPTQIAPQISSGVAKGDDVYAWYFENIKGALNNV
jgi:hypothetical protein